MSKTKPTDEQIAEAKASKAAKAAAKDAPKSDAKHLKEAKPSVVRLRDRLRRPADDRLLAGDASELVGADVGQLGVRRRLAEAHVDDHLLEAGDRHHIAVTELLGERRYDVLLIPLSQAIHLSITPSHLRQMRTLRSP